ncbi:MAG: class D sortase [Paenibacillaceae bacterium]|nr:class D sortase [Paenibacillaceae bacterium]
MRARTRTGRSAAAKRKTYSIAVAGIVFVLSVAVMVYAYHRIRSAGAAADRALLEWDKRQLSAPLSEPLPAVPLEDIAPFAETIFRQSAQPGRPEPPETELNPLPESDPQPNATLAANGDEQPPPKKRPTLGEVIGKVVIPKLDLAYAIIEGTDLPQLARGVGHYAESVLPGGTGYTVLAGHRDSVFRRLGEMKEGDEIQVETTEGAYTYRVTGSEIVDQDSRSVPLDSDKQMLTLITCYPFYYVGNAPKRFILYAEQLP